jgi:hypothetical protein
MAAEMKVGQFYYAPHRRMWGVWKNHNHGNGCSSGEFIMDFPSKDSARRFVYKMNGWNLNENKDEAQIQEKK